ncbi:MAG: hypothetical protein ACYC21_06450 [Eubacteriales bacterium]
MNFPRAAVLAVLTAINSTIVALGLWYTSATINGQTKIPIFGVEIPAFLLGFMVVYIGVRSYIKLFRLCKKLNNRELKFSWQNFRGGI